MAYKHLNTDELTFIESYYHQNLSVKEIAKRLKRSRQTIYNVINALKTGITALEYYQEYKQRKSNCGRHRIVLPENQSAYIREKVADGWTPDIIIGRGEHPIDCSVKTLYRMFKENIFSVQSLPMKGKRKPNGHCETAVANQVYIAMIVYCLNVISKLSTNSKKNILQIIRLLKASIWNSSHLWIRRISDNVP